MASFGSEILSLIGSVAPTIATYLGGPLAGVAVRALCGALGLSADAKPAEVSAALQSATPDQLLALKQADNAFAGQMKQLDVDFARLSSQDMASARQRETVVHDKTPAILAYLLTSGFFALVATMIFYPIPAASAGALEILLGALGTGWVQSLNYYFGSTYGSKTKDAMLFQSVPASSVALSPAAPAYHLGELGSRQPSDGPGRAPSPLDEGAAYGR